ncbi:hypothetical protein [Asticcacaulis machinosus]|uniref:Uncharacterized protein n=1 Tax=Asticcacaulis machinosus TaxID=2984211 RepID=A0ABT5HIW5_9CAUL|nr:hypothetical protein [Asticcacaulis machinosus]MDC7676168.1 hypothetical protein [Asticcacaulis machinosus]
MATHHHAPHDVDTDEPGKPPVTGFPWVIVTAIVLILGLIIAFTAVDPSSPTNNAADAAYQDNHPGSVSDPQTPPPAGAN